MRWLLWAFFGNDEDGPYGIFPPTRWGAVRWWLRNPLHNLFWHVLNHPGGPFWKWGHADEKRARGEPPGFNGYIGFRPPNGVLGFACRYEKH